MHIKLDMCTIKVVMRAAVMLSARARACVYSKHVTRLNLVKSGWGQGTEAATVAHDARKQRAPP